MVAAELNADAFCGSDRLQLGFDGGDRLRVLVLGQQRGRRQNEQHGEDGDIEYSLYEDSFVMNGYSQTMPSLSRSSMYG